MKRLILWIAKGALGLSIIALAGLSSAQGLNQISSGSSDAAPLLGNEHNYSVTVKTSGMLVVNAKIVLSNNTDTARTNFSFSGLGEMKGNPTGYQQIKGKHCKRVDYDNKKCLEYEDSDYSSYSYDEGYDESSMYQPLDLKIENGELSFGLRRALAPYKATAVVLSYYLSGQTNNGLFGQRKFTFNTLQDQDLVKTAIVSVSTDADLYTKAERSSITSSGSLGTSGIQALSPAISSKAFDSAVSKIGSYGEWMTKTSKDIIPGETFKVSGTYATSWFSFYWKTVFILLLILILIVVGIWWSIKKGRRQVLAKNNLPATNTGPGQVDNNISFHDAATFRNFLVSFLVAVCATLLFIGGIALFGYIMKSVGYDYDIIVGLSGVILGLILVGLVIGYPIYQGTRKGINMALVTIISYIVTIILAVVVSVIIISASSDNNSSVPSPVFQDNIIY